MVINPKELVRLSFPSFGHVVVLLIDVTAKDSNSIGLMSLQPKGHSVDDFHLPNFRAPGAATLTGTVPGKEARLLPAPWRRLAWQTQCCHFTASTQIWPRLWAALPSQPAPRWTRCSLCPGHHSSRRGTRSASDRGAGMQQMPQSKQQ